MLFSVIESCRVLFEYSLLNLVDCCSVVECRWVLLGFVECCYVLVFMTLIECCLVLMNLVECCSLWLGDAECCGVLCCVFTILKFS